LSIEHKQEIIRPHPDKLRGQELDFVTWAAEALHGSMRTPTEYVLDYENQEIIAEDGSRLGKIFQDSINYAEQMVQTQPQLAFELRRRKIEFEEYSEMVQMMNGLLPDTMIVVSDFPPELMSYPKDVGGYNVNRKQTFLRVIHRRNDGTMQMFSQTLDGSNRKALEAVYRSQGFVAEEGEMLGQRMHIDLREDNPADLVDALMRTYDLSLNSQTGLNFRAGILASNSRVDNTLDFVKNQKDIVDYAVAQIQNGVLEENRYDLVALLVKRFDAVGRNDSMELFQGYYNSASGFMIQQTHLQQDLLMAGIEARLAGKVYSGCGITSTSSLDAVDELNKAGFGNKTESSNEDYSFDSYQYCVSCQAPPSSEEEKKKWCGPCGLCKSCDKKAGGKG
jgi:hypothetical protein